MIKKAIKSFFQLESISGILLVIATITAILTANYATDFYQYFTGMHLTFSIDTFAIDKPLVLWVNDGLMAIFFFVIGLELKREVLAGELSNPRNVILPLVGAIAGMLVPAIIYVAFNFNDSAALKGWAIPSATDIAFALGVLLLLGKRVPNSLKIFLLTLAIVDDLGAIIVIAIFYTSEVHVLPLIIATGSIVTLFMFNRTKVSILAPYLIVGLILWVAMLKSGVHATLAGVITAMFIPYRKAFGSSKTMLEEMEHDLHPIVTYMVLPLFAFVNMGIGFEAFSIPNLGHEISLGIIFGLIIGKQFGIFGVCYLMIKMNIAQPPKGSTLLQLYGVSALCGIGFTMSLFIGSLAFYGNEITIDERFSILVGSIVSGIIGYTVLYFASKKKST